MTLLTLIKNYLAPPTFRDDPETTSRAHILNTLINSALFISILIIPGIIFVFKYKLGSTIAAILVLTMVLVCKGFCKSGKVNLASHIFIGSIYLTFLIVNLLQEKIDTSELCILIGVCASASILLSQRKAIVLASVAVILVLSRAAIEAIGIDYPHLFFSTPFNGVFFFTLALAFTMVPLFLAIAGLKAALKQSEFSKARFTTMFQKAPVMYVVGHRHSLSLVVADCSEAFLTTLGYTYEEVIGRSAIDFYSPKSRLQFAEDQLLEKVIHHEAPGQFERELITKNGFVVHTLAQAAPEKNERGEVIGLLITFLDISQRKAAEEQVQQSLVEKDILLQELYHRTKNNMEVILALLRLEADKSGREEVKQSFKNAQDRILSMALVHQKLYEAKDLANVNLKNYIGELSTLLMKSHGVTGNKISTHFDIEDIVVPIDTAIPCGLIITELLTNSFKHAFTADMNGTVVLKLSRDPLSTIYLLFTDDGVGLPLDFNFQRKGNLGWQNIFLLGEKQLGGKVVVDGRNGLKVQLTFPEVLPIA